MTQHPPAAEREQVLVTGLPVSCDVNDIARTGERPNILLIAMDQLRADWLGCNGHPICQTPHLDDLANFGINFKSAMSECPVCCPARRIMMTGLDPYGINMFQNRDLQEFPEGPKLAECLSGVGYQCHGVGKMHTWPPRGRMGFHDIEINEEGRTAGHDYPDDYQQFIQEAGLGPQVNAHGTGNNQYGYRPNLIPEWATTTGWTADRAMRFLRRRDPEQPFFLYVSFDKPHPPFTPPPEFYDMYRDKTFDEPVRGEWVGSKLGSGTSRLDAIDRRPDVIQESLRAYAACITHIDTRIGQLLGTLRETGVMHNTWIMVTADHGDMTMDHGRRAKGTFLAGSCSVPYLLIPPVSADGKVPNDVVGRVDNKHPVGLSDILPTFCDLAGAPIPEGIPGRSLMSIVHEKNAEWRDYLFGIRGELYCANDGRYRYQWSGVNEEELLFDHHEDPKDMHDLSDKPEYADIKERLRHALTEWMTANDDIHIDDGKLIPVPVRVEGAHTVGFTNSPWNNRGWRG